MNGLSRPFGRLHCHTPLHSDSPVEKARKEGPRGDGNWPGYSYVYRNIAQAAEVMGRKPYIALSQDHIDTMADLGSGHEERMKYRQMWLKTYGYIA